MKLLQDSYNGQRLRVVIYKQGQKPREVLINDLAEIDMQMKQSHVVFDLVRRVIRIRTDDHKHTLGYSDFARLGKTKIGLLHSLQIHPGQFLQPYDVYTYLERQIRTWCVGNERRLERCLASIYSLGDREGFARHLCGLRRAVGDTDHRVILSHRKPCYAACYNPKLSYIVVRRFDAPPFGLDFFAPD